MHSKGPNKRATNKITQEKSWTFCLIATTISLLKYINIIYEEK